MLLTTLFWLTTHPSFMFKIVYNISKTLLSLCILSHNYNKKICNNSMHMMFRNPHLKVIMLLQRCMSMMHCNKLFTIRYKLKSMILDMFMFRNLNSLLHTVKKLMKILFSMTMFNLVFLSPLLDLGKNLFIAIIDLVLDIKKQLHFSFQIIQHPFSFRVLDSSMKIPLPICLKVHLQICLKL